MDRSPCLTSSLQLSYQWMLSPTATGGDAESVRLIALKPPFLPPPAPDDSGLVINFDQGNPAFVRRRGDLTGVQPWWKCSD